MRPTRIVLLISMAVLASTAEAQILEWASAIGGAGEEEIFGIAYSRGDVYTVGEFEGTVDFDPGPGELPLGAPGERGNFLMKQGPSGALVWALAFPRLLRPRDVAVAEDGAIYMAGEFFSVQDFDPGPGSVLRQSSGSGDIFALKLNAAGGFEWVYTVGASQLD